MAHVAFVSYSKIDKEIVESICQALEDNGLGCWYAPRNVPAGADWDASIMEALAASRVMILVWSSHSDQSKQVKREVALALDEIGVTVIPFRVEKVKSSKLRYYLSGIQWFDSSLPPPEENLKLLVEQVKVAIPVVGQLLVSEEERLERARRAKEEPGPEQVSERTGETGARPPQAERPTNAGEKARLLNEVEELQAAEAEALEEAEAAAYRQARLRAEVAALKRADALVLPPVEAEVLRRAAEAEAERYAKEKAGHLARVEFLHTAVEAALARAEKELTETRTAEGKALGAEAKYTK